jgi:hypothetical protein
LALKGQFSYESTHKWWLDSISECDRHGYWQWTKLNKMKSNLFKFIRSRCRVGNSYRNEVDSPWGGVNRRPKQGKLVKPRKISINLFYQLSNTNRHMWASSLKIWTVKIYSDMTCKFCDNIS